MAAVLITVASGAADVSKVAFAGGEFGIFTHADLAFAGRVREATPPTATILTAPDHNHPVLLSGRRLFLGYEGHLWSQGLDYKGRQNSARSLFQGAPQPGEAGPRVDAIALTPHEAELIPPFSSVAGFPSLVDSPYRLLRIR